MIMSSDRLPNSPSSYELDGRKRRCQLVGGCLNSIRHGDRKAPVALQHAPCSEHRQTHDPTGSGRVADDVALRRLLTLARLRLAYMQIQHVVVSIVVGVIEAQRPDRDVYALHDLGSFRLANAETIRAGTCS